MENRLLKELTVFASTRNRVCPKPPAWDRFYQLLKRLDRSGGKSSPPVPLILNGWGVSSNEEKQARLQEQIRWAAEHCDLGSVDSFLLRLRDEEWHFSAPPDNKGKTITIMPDFGFGPYLWVKDTSDESGYVGENWGSYQWMHEELSLSADLRADFDRWILQFENESHLEGFNWEAFHARALELSKLLKAQVGSRFAVQYCKPYEDPNHEENEVTKLD